MTKQYFLNIIYAQSLQGNSKMQQNKEIALPTFDNLPICVETNLTLEFDGTIPGQLKIMTLSPHWFRHQSASMQARIGISAEHIRENMRHASHQTTMIYVHADDGDRISTINNLFW